MPEPKAQDNFTDPDSRIMKRAGGGFDPSYNAQTAVDDTAHIIVAAELGNNAADVGQLLPMLQAVQDNLGALPAQGLADAGYRSEENFAKATRPEMDLVVALGREGKQQAQVDAAAYPHTAAMAAKLQTTEGRPPTAAASGSPSRPTAGSRTCWGSASSACEDCNGCRPSGSSCAWR